MIQTLYFLMIKYFTAKKNLRIEEMKKNGEKIYILLNATRGMAQKTLLHINF